MSGEGRLSRAPGPPLLGQPEVLVATLWSPRLLTL